MIRWCGTCVCESVYLSVTCLRPAKTAARGSNVGVYNYDVSKYLAVLSLVRQIVLTRLAFGHTVGLIVVLAYTFLLNFILALRLDHSTPPVSTARKHGPSVGLR